MSPIIPRVSLNPLPGARVNPNAPIEAFGGGAAAQTVDLSGVANVAAAEAQKNALERARLRQEAADEADQVATTHAYSATKTGTNDILHGPDGLLNRRGKDAFTIDQDAYDRYGELVHNIREQLGTDRQRAIYDKMVLNEWNQVDSQIQPHIAAQRRVFDKEGTEAGIDANNTRVMATYSDPAIVDDAIAHNQALAAGYLQRQGAPEEAIANKKAEIESGMRLDVLKQYVDNKQDLSATAYFDKYKDKFVGDTLLKAETLVNGGTIDGEAIRQAEAIINGTPGRGLIADPQAAAAKIADPRVQEKVEQRIRQHNADIATNELRSRQKGFDKGLEILLANGGDPNGIPVSVRQQMGAVHYENLMVHAKQIRYPEIYGPGDPEKFQEMLNKSYLDQEGFAAEDISSIPGLNVSQRTQLTRRRGTVSNQLQRAAQGSVHTTTLDADVTSAIEDPTGAKKRALDAAGAKLSADPSLDDALHSARPLKAPTPTMLHDVARSGGGGSPYAQLLRDSSFAIPHNLPALEVKPAEKPKTPTTTKTVVNRDKSGRITDTQTTVIKPE